MTSKDIEEFNLDHYNFFASVAKDLNCTIKSLSNNYIFEVFSIDKNKKFYIFGNALPLNNNVAQKICSDKSATSTILLNNGVSCVEHVLLKNPSLFKNWNEEVLQNLLKEYKTVVVKDNHGSCGNLIYKANNIKEAKKSAQLIFDLNKDVAISPFVNFTDEYRLIMLNNKCEICFKKTKPFVVGDGKNTVLYLTEKKYGKEALKVLDLSSKNFKPKADETVCVGWKNNLKMLAGVEDVLDKNLKKKLAVLAKATTKALNINFCSVDILDDNGILKVLEVNSTVSALRFAGSSKEHQKQVKMLFKKAFQQELSKQH